MAEQHSWRHQLQERHVCCLREERQWTIVWEDKTDSCSQQFCLLCHREMSVWFPWSGDLQKPKDGLSESIFKWFLAWTWRSAWLLPFTSLQSVWSVSNSPSPLISFRMSDINKCVTEAVISVLPRATHLLFWSKKEKSLTREVKANMKRRTLWRTLWTSQGRKFKCVEITKN